MKRKLLFYSLAGLFFFTLGAGLACRGQVPTPAPASDFNRQSPISVSSRAQLITLFLGGDVMTGRGIDQGLPHPSDPRLHEPFMASARGYVDLAEQAGGSIPQPINFAYIWGDALAEWDRVKPDVRLINLETSVTTSNDYWPGKGIHYRMHPRNIPALTAAHIDFCALANNHVLDWGYAGLTETLATLRQANIHRAGAGQHRQAAETPAVIDVEAKGRVLVFAYGVPTAGIPVSWAAAADRPGVNLLPDLSDQTVQHIRAQVAAVEQAGDIVVASLHWGQNWGYEILPEQREFAHKLIEQAGVDVIHGHSSHHVKGIEVYRDKPILYGAGDLLNDYEGISGHEEFRADLVLMYFLTMEPVTGQLVQLRMTPLQIKHFRLNRVSPADALWLSELLTREGQPLGTQVELTPDNTLTLNWH